MVAVLASCFGQLVASGCSCCCVGAADVPLVTAGGESCCVDTEEATEGELRELELESEGSSPDVSDSDSDEMLTLDDLMQQCLVDFDADAHAGPL